MLAIRGCKFIVPCGAIRQTKRCRLPAQHCPHVACYTASASSTSAASVPHKPVLMQEVLDIFSPVKLQVYVDGTLGAAGHASALLQAHLGMQTLIGIDADPAALQLAEARLSTAASPPPQLHLLQGNFRHLLELLEAVPGCGPGKVDGMLLDLGVSSMQVDQADRGFSFMRPGGLDMRMGPGAALSAEELLNTWPEAELGRIIREYGEERHWRGIASRIVAARQQQPLLSTQDLVALIGGGYGKKAKGIHPATRTFQALRIAVNDELGALEAVLPQALAALRPKGRLAVISFHSLEDRLVKRAFLAASGRPPPDESLGQGPLRFADQLPPQPPPKQAQLLTRRPMTASSSELEHNPRARSAKLRVLERL